MKPFHTTVALLAALTVGAAAWGQNVPNLPPITPSSPKNTPNLPPATPRPPSNTPNLPSMSPTPSTPVAPGPATQPANPGQSNSGWNVNGNNNAVGVNTPGSPNSTTRTPGRSAPLNPSSGSANNNATPPAGATPAPATPGSAAPSGSANGR